MFAIATMPALSPSTWAFHKPANSSPLAFSSPPRSNSESSPLSPLSGNVSRRNAFSSPPSADSTIAAAAAASGCGTTTSKLFRFADRPAKPNPLLRRRDEGQAARRTLFLKNVRNRSDDKRWERRAIEGHAIRSWYEEEQEIARSMGLDQAAMVSDADIEEAAVFGGRDFSSIPNHFDEMMLDDITRQEELEMEALLESMDETEATHDHREVPRGVAPQPEQASYSDDEADYDEIFRDLIPCGASRRADAPDDVEMC